MKRRSTRTAQPGWVYLLQTGWHYKIGKSSDVRARIAGLQTASPYLIKLLHAVQTDDMGWLETLLHETYQEYRTNGEWFELPSNIVEEVQQMMTEYALTEPAAVLGIDDTVTCLTPDYTVVKLPRVDLDYVFPNEATRQGYYLSFTTAPCPISRGTVLTCRQDCAVCGGYSEVYLLTMPDDYVDSEQYISIVCGDEPVASLIDVRPLTPDERAQQAAYIHWLEVEFDT